MADLHLDNNVSLLLAQILRDAGHSVAAARDLGLAAATDDTQLLVAAQSGRILVTHNRKDFMLLHDAWRTWPRAFGLALPAHPGILALDQAPPTVLSRAIEELLVPAPPESFACFNEMFCGGLAWAGAGGSSGQAGQV
jgi:hypothetical protein